MAKHNHNRSDGADHIFATDLETYLDSPEFREYAILVQAVIHADETGRGVTTRHIHQTLGEHARPEWTQDALDSLYLDKVGVLPTRYVIRQGQRLRWHNIPAKDSFRRIFPDSINRFNDDGPGSPPYKGGVDAASADGVVLS